ncbi:hypothetical protein TWF970_007748 [Orbilia oligospora]|uniref:Peptidase S53 domain-containing protein n=1 Tax=Orbilia oligospora TaxID=2813651 RepID=A0A7C8V2B4_ORBOL|nr:hypothetical protein TWF970_007748 [Orbilia oligospora]
MFAPDLESERTVIKWLEDSGSHPDRISISSNRQWVQFDALVSEVQTLLHTSYHIYEHEGSGRLNVACDECIRELYRIAELPVGTRVNSSNKLGIFQGLGQLYSQNDVGTFNRLFTRIPCSKGNPELRSIDGGRGSTSSLTDEVGDESNLDIQASHHIIYPQGQALFSTDDPPTQNNYNYSGFLNNYLDGIDGSYCSFTAFGITGNSNSTDPPLDPPYPNPKNAGKPGAFPGPLDCGTQSPTYVTSISYGGPENTLGLPANYQLRQCAEFMKLALQGYTHVVASGDSGVAAGGEDGDNPNGCFRPAGQTSGPGTIFNPDFPSNCPYILSVGSTEYVNGGRERATQAFGSGGGFSNVHARPSYQSAAVASYFASQTLPFGSYDLTDPNQRIGSGGGLYNRGGRGYPDVAALGYNILIVTRGFPALVGGTSASAPIWAAMLTRVNEERLKRNMPTIGFVHPALYQNATLFNRTGFPTATGWDPVTGLGSITLPNLFRIFGVA